MNLMSNGKLSDISITSEDLVAEQAAATGSSFRQKSPSYLGLLPTVGPGTGRAPLPSFEARNPATLSQAAARIPKRFTFDSAALKARGMTDDEVDMLPPNSDGSTQGKLSDSSTENFGAGASISLSVPKGTGRKRKRGGGAVVAMG